MKTALRAAALALVGLGLGGCEAIYTISPYAYAPNVVSGNAARPSSEVRAARRLGDPVSMTAAARPADDGTVAPSRVTEPLPQAGSGREVAWAADRRDAADRSTPEDERDSQRRQQQQADNENLERLNRVAAQAIRSICTGC